MVSGLVTSPKDQDLILSGSAIEILMALKSKRSTALLEVKLKRPCDEVPANDMISKFYFMEKRRGRGRNHARIKFIFRLIQCLNQEI